MKTHRVMSLMLALALGWSAPAMGQQTAEERFQAGLYQEEVQGNLEQAVTIYQAILREYASERAVAAKAQLHIGICYETLGQKEAQQAYQRVISAYGDQAEVVSQARERLAALAVPAPATLTLRRLENPPADAPSRARPSPNGRYLSFWDWETGDLAVRDLQTGQDRRLTDEGEPWGSDAPVFQEAGESTWSPDSRQVAYLWTVDSARELRIVGLEGGEPRVLARYEDGQSVRFPADWSPDGRWILLSRALGSGLQEMFMVSAIDGSTRTLGTTDDDSDNMRFSPDGHHVVYDALQDSDNPERDIFLRSIDGGQVTPLIQHPADDFLLGWSADGKWLVFASDRTGAIGLWVVKMADGKPEGTPTLVREGIGRALPIGLTRNGALYYGIVRASVDVYEADLDPETGQVGTPRKAIEDHEGNNYAPAYSPDGRYLAHVSQRGSSPYPTNAGNTLCIRSLDTGENREFYREFWRLGVRTVVGPRWSPDGRFITVGGYLGNSANKIDLYRVDVATGQIDLVYRSKPDEDVTDGRFGPDGTHYMVRGSRKENYTQVVAQDLETGEEREVYRSPRYELRLRIGISPDGRWLSLLNNDNGIPRSLRLMPTEGGNPREIWSFGRTEPGTPSLSHWWTPDGKYILYNGAPDDPYQRELWRLPVQGGRPERIGVFDLWGPPFSLSVHPSGRRIVFESKGTADTDSEVWVMENFLPASEDGGSGAGA